MPDQSNPVSFRRIHGRIVPIKTLKQKNDIKSAGKYLGAGVATAAVTAEAASQVTKGAATLRMAAKQKFKASNGILNAIKKGGQMNFDFAGTVSGARKQKSTAKLLRAASYVIRKGRVPILAAGAAASGYAVSKGVSKLNQAFTNRRKLNEQEQAVAFTAGAGAAAGIGTLYYKRLGLPLSKAIKTAAAARAGNPYKFGKIPLNTIFGQLKFRF